MECWCAVQQNLELREAVASARAAAETEAEQGSWDSRYAFKANWLYAFIYLAYPTLLTFGHTTLMASLAEQGAVAAAQGYTYIILPWVGFYILLYPLAWYAATSIYSVALEQALYYEAMDDDSVVAVLPEPQETFTIVLDFLDANFALFFLAAYLA